mgnify:CR=1 FL=1
MAWLQLRIDTDATQASTVELILDLLGATSITFEDAANQPMYEPPLGTNPLWHLTRITALFDADTDQQQLIDQLTEQLQVQTSKPEAPAYQLQLIEDKAWQTEWMKHIQPLRFGDNLWIVPEGFDTPEPDAVNLRFNPGLAFGTGSHPTTALCLEWLSQQDLNNKTLIDYGCGSGILGIAACMLGTRENHMVDIDTQALDSTRLNAQLNDQSDKQIRCYLPESFDNTQSDILVANILATPLIENAEKFSTLVPSKGLLALSGILYDQIDSVRSAYEQWFDFEPPSLKEEWVLLKASRK